MEDVLRLIMVQLPFAKLFNVQYVNKVWYTISNETRKTIPIKIDDLCLKYFGYYVGIYAVVDRNMANWSHIETIKIWAHGCVMLSELIPYSNQDVDVFEIGQFLAMLPGTQLIMRATHGASYSRKPFPKNFKISAVVDTLNSGEPITYGDHSIFSDITSEQSRRQCMDIMCQQKKRNAKRWMVR